MQGEKAAMMGRRKPQGGGGSPTKKSDGRKELKEYIDIVLNLGQQGQQGKKTMHKEREEFPTDPSALPTFLEKLMKWRVENLSSSQIVQLMVHVLCLARITSVNYSHKLVTNSPNRLLELARAYIRMEIEKSQTGGMGIGGNETEHEAVEALLLCLSGVRVQQDYTHMTPDVWSTFVENLPAQFKNNLVKKLLEFSSRKLSTVDTDPDLFVALVKGIEAALSHRKIAEELPAFLKFKTEQTGKRRDDPNQNDLLATFLSYRKLGQSDKATARLTPGPVSKQSDDRHEQRGAADKSAIEYCQMLLQMYIDMSAMEGLGGLSETFDSSLARRYVAERLLALWGDEKHPMQEHVKLLPHFLTALSDTVLHLSKRTADKIESAAGRKQDDGSSEPDPQTPKTGDDSPREELALRTNFQLLCLLTKNPLLERFITSSLACRAAPQLLWMTDVSLHPNVENALKTDYGMEDFCDNTCGIVRRITINSFKEVMSAFSFNLDIATRIIMADRGVSSAQKFHEDASAIAPKELITLHKDWKNGDVSREDEDDLTSTYQKTLRRYSLTSASLVPSHSFRAILERFSPTSRKSQVLEKEMQYLEEHLPVLPERAIFLVRDSERYDVLRCAMSGPVGTPYSRGLFTFDIYCPDGYPRCPPLVRFLTTGYGTVDFHACLGANGEVFLTLLGTGSGDDGSQAWDPETSSISQVLETIQISILEKSPLFSYPCKREQAEDKGERDEEESQLHNSLVQVQTLRYAMLEQLHFPLPGLEEVVGRHFSLQREVIAKQCQEWGAQSKDVPLSFNIFWLAMPLTAKLDQGPER